MTDRIRVDVQGVDKFLAAMKGFRLRMSDLKEAWARIGDKVKSDAIIIAPKLTGQLINTIRAGRSKSRATVRAGNSKVVYAGVQHYGWPGHNIEAKPFLVIAAQENRDYAKQELSKETAKAIRQFKLN